MDWITDQIAIGNYLDAQAVSPELDAILCLKEHCCDERRTDLDILSLPLIDGAGNPAWKIEEAVDFIAGTVAAGGKILVHCHAGRSRSVVVVARYLMASRGMVAAAALALIAAKRDIYLSDGIDRLLRP